MSPVGWFSKLVMVTTIEIGGLVHNIVGNPSYTLITSKMCHSRASVKYALRWVLNIPTPTKGLHQFYSTSHWPALIHSCSLGHVAAVRVLLYVLVNWLDTRKVPYRHSILPQPQCKSHRKGWRSWTAVPELLPRIRFQKISGLVESSHDITLLDNPQPNIWILLIGAVVGGSTVRALSILLCQSLQFCVENQIMTWLWCQWTAEHDSHFCPLRWLSNPFNKCGIAQRLEVHVTKTIINSLWPIGLRKTKYSDERQQHNELKSEA